MGTAFEDAQTELAKALAGLLGNIEKAFDASSADAAHQSKGNTMSVLPSGGFHRFAPALTAALLLFGALVAYDHFKAPPKFTVTVDVAGLNKATSDLTAAAQRVGTSADTAKQAIAQEAAKIPEIAAKAAKEGFSKLSDEQVNAFQADLDRQKTQVDELQKLSNRMIEEGRGTFRNINAAFNRYHLTTEESAATIKRLTAAVEGYPVKLTESSQAVHSALEHLKSLVEAVPAKIDAIPQAVVAAMPAPKAAPQAQAPATPPVVAAPAVVPAKTPTTLEGDLTTKVVKYGWAHETKCGKQAPADFAGAKAEAFFKDVTSLNDLYNKVDCGVTNVGGATQPTSPSTADSRRSAQVVAKNCPAGKVWEGEDIGCI